MIRHKGLSAYRANRREVGSCNACGPEDWNEKVWCIRLGQSLEIRLCDKHVKELKQKCR